jgi:hypothetical protein
MLLGIWWTSLLLCAAALAALAALIGVRAYRRRRDLRDLDLSRVLRRDLVVWLNAPSHDISSLRKTAAARPAFVEALLFRAAEMVQGDEQSRLVALAQTLGLQARLAHALGHGRTAHRRRAAETLAMFESDEAVAALRAALEDKHAAVRLAAARALSGQGQPVSLAPLAQDSGWFGDSILVHDLFGKLAAHQSGDLAGLAADEGMAPRLRAAAAQALAEAGRYECLPQLLEMTGSGHESLRVAGATALGVLGHPRGAAALRPLLRDPDWPVRAAAAQAAGRIGSPDLARDIEATLNDENWWVRARAAGALGALGAAGRAALSRIAQGQPSPARDAAALSLANPQESA